MRLLQRTSGPSLCCQPVAICRLAISAKSNYPQTVVNLWFGHISQVELSAKSNSYFYLYPELLGYSQKSTQGNPAAMLVPDP
jgi:hypothetical protein